MGHALAERHFSPYETVQKWVDEWFVSKEQFFWRGIHKLPEKWEKCMFLNECWFCDEREDTPEHTLWTCSEWESYRAEARAGGLDLNRSTIGNELVESKSKWVAFEGLIEKILRAKIVRENERKKSGVRNLVRT
ncbi:uncharacterized protein [Euwallacea fornicatus]|uniref:uncharacterized protein n=1 Tax=Euwallacea fornicatus TaxID=995702 RepID=UPI00338F3C3C